MSNVIPTNETSKDTGALEREDTAEGLRRGVKQSLRSAMLKAETMLGDTEGGFTTSARQIHALLSSLREAAFRLEALKGEIASRGVRS